MRSSRTFLALALIIGVMAAPAPASSKLEEKKQGCTAKDWGYRCFYDAVLDVENKMSFVPPVPEAGFITSMQATLVDKYGTVLDRHAAHLHHVVWANPNRGDLTCQDNAFFGQVDRFFASGKERSKITFPEGHGYYWENQPPPQNQDAPPIWVMIYHLMSMHGNADQEVMVRFDVGFEAGGPDDMIDVTPLWFDVRNCSTSEYDIDKGSGVDGVHVEPWSYTMPIGGSFVALGGHLHDGGLKIRLDNQTTGEKIVVSRAGYGNKKRKKEWDLKSMSVWTGYPGVPVSAGDELLLRAFYNDSRNREGAMGIMIGALVPDE